MMRQVCDGFAAFGEEDKEKEKLWKEKSVKSPLIWTMKKEKHPFL